MTALAFVDTNLLVYARDAAHPRKQEQAAAWMRHLWTTKSGRLSYQILQEYYLTVTGKLKPGLPARAARDDVRALLTWYPVRPEGDILEGAWAIQDRFGLSWWDALVVSAALAVRCDMLLTEDLQDGQDFGGVRVVNPFANGPPPP
jgi:predicted nucleic acid-binding protein